MRKAIAYLVVLIATNFLSLTVFAQTVAIKGNVKNASNKEAASSVSITVKGSDVGTYSDDKGNFTIITTQKLPIILVFTSIGFETKEVSVSTPEDALQVNLNASSAIGQEVVVSATRTPSRILESPVTVERIGLTAIKNSPSVSYYDVIANLKGVDLVTSSLTFKTPGTRGFLGSGNLRLNQIVDGMDNQAPGLNFSVGSVIGLTELDVESMELLPGASSALYGPGGMNGALVINSKNPFKYQGLSFQVKTGIMHVDRSQREVSPYFNWNVRWAQKVNKNLAFKIGAEMIQAKDWLANDNRNYKRLGTTGFVTDGTRATDPNYDGVNVYGDETTADIRAVLNGVAAQAPFLAPYIATLTTKAIDVSRTGYTEKEVVNPNTLNVKLSGAIHYKITEKLEAVASGFWGNGNTVYTGSDRYSLKDLKMGQYKLELNGKYWNVRWYTTQENAGESFNATVSTRLFNEAWKPSGGGTGWFAQYGQAFLGAKLNGLTDINAHNFARSQADIGRPAAGTAQFKTIFDAVRKVPIVKGGGLFVDKTDLYNTEGQYNFSHLLNDAFELIAGANFKKYVLNSEGTLFADSAGTIGITEMGAYAQATKRLFDDKLKLIASARYDKNENFKGKLTPRFSAVVRLAKDNNLRVSYQTAYRFPSTQQQWINLSVGGGVRLLGGLPDLRRHFNIAPANTYTLESFQASGGGANPALLKQGTFPEFKAESVKTFEFGYKGLLANKKLLADVYAYFGTYTNFIARRLFAQVNGGVPTYYSIPQNVDGNVKTNGFGLSLDYSLPSNFLIGVNVSSDKLGSVPTGFQAGFNSPQYRTNVTVGNTGFGYKKRLSANLVWRWQDAYFYEGDFSNGNLPAIHTVDAQISYRLPEFKSTIKLGAANLLNQYYRNGFGNANVGGLYYVTYGYNL